MILDKKNNQQTLLMTISESTNDLSNLILEIEHLITNVIHHISLPADSSDFPNRFNKFILSTDSFSECELGQYKFNVKQNENIVERGLLTIINSANKSEYKQNETDNNNEYLIYKDNSTNNLVAS